MNHEKSSPLDKHFPGVENRYLGWHYMNQIDTCISISTPFPLDIGVNHFTWDGKDKCGHPVPLGDYAYYIWAYDATSPGVKVTDFIQSRRFIGAQILTKDGEGQLLADWENSGEASNPSWYSPHAPLYGMPFSGGPV